MMIPVEETWHCQNKRCGYKKPIENSEHEIIEVSEKEPRDILIIDGNLDTLPKTKIECESCGNGEAYWVLRQTRAADEPETRIYQCTKCGHKWREY